MALTEFLANVNGALNVEIKHASTNVAYSSHPINKESMIDNIYYNSIISNAASIVQCSRMLFPANVPELIFSNVILAQIHPELSSKDFKAVLRQEFSQSRHLS